MSDIYKTLTISDSKELRIIRDYDSIDPRKDDNLGTMVCFHGRYNLGDKHDFNSPDDFMEYVNNNHKDIAVVLPLYLYDHSGITMSTTPFSCSWDSGQVGWIYVTKETLRKELGYKKIPKRSIEWAENILKGEIETYDQYLTGDVYGFNLVEKTKCSSCQHIKEEIVDSCWGFFGDNFETNGILDCLSKEEKEIVLSQI